MRNYFFATVDEQQLNDLAAGRPAPYAIPWAGRHQTLLLNWRDQLGAIWREVDGVAQPIVLVCPQDDQRRLFGRFAQVRSDFSPVTSWCHVFAPAQLELVDSLSRDPALNGWEASWSGLAIAEALLLAERSIARIRLPACQATQSFALART